MKRTTIITSLAFGGASLSVIIYGLFIIILNWPINIHSVEKAGVFGDSFGMLTSLFSALAFGGVIWTVNSQREELELQKQEIIKNQKEVLKQGFESTFFQMLKLHNNMLESITTNKVNPLDKPYTENGRAVFEYYKDYLKHQVSYSPGSTELEKVIQGYKIFWDVNGHQVAHYYRFLYNIFRYIDESEIPNKKFYTRLVRAQLSNQELFILYYNSLSPLGKNFKKYILKYTLMDNLSKSELINAEHSELLPGTIFYD